MLKQGIASIGMVCASFQFSIGLDVPEDTSASLNQQFSLEVGIHRTWRQKPDHISVPSSPQSDLSSPAAWGYTFYPTTGFHIKALVDVISRDGFSLRTGVAFHQWKLIYKADSLERFNALLQYYGDTTKVLASGHFSNTKSSYNGSYFTISTPIHIGYTGKKIGVFAGLNLNILSYENARQTSLNGIETKENELFWDSSLSGDGIELSSSWELIFYFKARIINNDMYLKAGLYTDGFLSIGVNVPLK